MWGSRVLVCCVLAACAGDNRLDPSDLELRDLLGIAPDTALTWDADQRASARRVIDAALRDAAAPFHAPPGSVAHALADADADRDRHHLAALGVVEVTLEPDGLEATPRTSSLGARAIGPIELRLAGWSRWNELPARGLDVLTAIASDVGHHRGPIVVSPVPQLAVLAGYVPATAKHPAQLVVNPVLLAALEPGGPPVPPPAPPSVVAADTVGNPYSFYDSIGACATAQETRCEACMPSHTCTPTSGNGDGNAECKGLAADQGRGYWLVCVEFALAIDSVKSCTEANAPSCPVDQTGDFVDRPECASALDACLGDHGGSTPHPPDPSTGCSDATCDATSCEDSTGGCEGGDCSSDSGGGDCSSDSGDGCDGGDSGGDCSGGGGDDCSGGGGDCAGDSGGDCSGGGGDDCNAGGRHRDHGYLWACLPLPFAIIARRRADRRRAS